MASLAPLCVILFVSFHTAHASENNAKESVMDKLSSGMKFAQDFLGSESVALKVAEFVVRAFQNANSPRRAATTRRPPSYYDDYDESHSDETRDQRPQAINEVPTSPWKHLVRIFGLQPSQISAVAVNALVFVAQMISTFLAGTQRPIPPYRSEDPTSWILNKKSQSLQDLITAARNESLSDNIENLIKQQDTEEETSCIRLLVCKITPFVNRMQKAVFGKAEEVDQSIRGSAIMYRHLPSEREIRDRSDVCERRHSKCDLNE